MTPGRLLRAPEGFLGSSDCARVAAEARSGRRDFLRRSFAAAAALPAMAAPAADGDPNIL